MQRSARTRVRMEASTRRAPADVRPLGVLLRQQLRNPRFCCLSPFLERLIPSLLLLAEFVDGKESLMNWLRLRFAELHMAGGAVSKITSAATMNALTVLNHKGLTTIPGHLNSATITFVD